MPRPLFGHRMRFDVATQLAQHITVLTYCSALWIELYRLLERLCSLCEASLLAEGPSACEVCLDSAWVEAEGIIGRFDCLGLPFEHKQCVPQLARYRGLIRTLLQFVPQAYDVPSRSVWINDYIER